MYELLYAKEKTVLETPKRDCTRNLITRVIKHT